MKTNQNWPLALGWQQTGARVFEDSGHRLVLCDPFLVLKGPDGTSQKAPTAECRLVVSQEPQHSVADPHQGPRIWQLEADNWGRRASNRVHQKKTQL